MINSGVNLCFVAFIIVILSSRYYAERLNDFMPYIESIYRMMT